MTSKIKVNILADGGDNAIITSDGAGSFTASSGLASSVSSQITFPDNTPSFYAQMNGTNQTGMSPNTNTKVQFATEIYDTDSAYDTSNYRFTVPSGKAGKYFIGSNINFGSSTQGRSSYICIYKNGGQIQQFGQFFWTNYGSNPNVIEGTQDYTVSAMAILDLSAGDYIEIYGRRYDGTSIYFRGNTGNNFFGYKIIGA